MRGEVWKVAETLVTTLNFESTGDNGVGEINAVIKIFECESRISDVWSGEKRPLRQEWMWNRMNLSSSE